jgi:RNA polymerase sigma factor (sigma-70 family)
MDIARLEELDSLLRKIAGQDKAAFTALYSLTERRIRNYLQHRAPYLPESEIEAVMGDVYLGIWKGASSYSGKTPRGGNPEAVANAWMIRLARNKLFYYFRKDRISRKHEILESDMTSDPENPDKDLSPLERLPDSSSPGPEQALTSRQGIEEFRAGLTPLEQRIFDLQMEGFPQKEIAKKLSVTPSAVNQHIRSIRNKARAFLDQAGPPGNQKRPIRNT